MLEHIVHASILLPEGFLEDGACAFENGVLQYIGTEPLENAKTVLDAKGALLLPDFIDLHCHGGNGYDFMDATPEQMRNVSQFHLRHRTTTLVATTMTDSWEAVCEALNRIAVLFQSNDQGTIHGVHLEGPWLNPTQCGAQDTRKMDLLDPDRLRELKKKYPFVERISAAPELPKGMELGDTGVKLGLVMSIAHTENEILQNQFTAYVSRAIRHRRINYIRKWEQKNLKEFSFSEIEDFVPVEDNKVGKLLVREALRLALCQIREKDRKIVLARVVDEKPFTEIAQEMGMTYKAVTHLYYRVLKRLKVNMEGVDNG